MKVAVKRFTVFGCWNYQKCGTDDTEIGTETGETGAGQVKVDIPPELENKKYEQHTEEEREVLRDQDHAIANDQLTYDKSTMKVEIAKSKDAENCSSPNEKAAETISRKILEKKYPENNKISKPDVVLEYKQNGFLTKENNKWIFKYKYKWF